MIERFATSLSPKNYAAALHERLDACARKPDPAVQPETDGASMRQRVTRACKDAWSGLWRDRQATDRVFGSVDGLLGSCRRAKGGAETQGERTEGLIPTQINAQVLQRSEEIGRRGGAWLGVLLAPRRCLGHEMQAVQDEGGARGALMGAAVGRILSWGVSQGTALLGLAIKAICLPGALACAWLPDLSSGLSRQLAAALFG